MSSLQHMKINIFGLVWVIFRLTGKFFKECYRAIFLTKQAFAECCWRTSSEQ